MDEYRICERCVMDSTIPRIVFYDDGTCSYCREYERRQGQEVLPEEERTAALSLLVRRIKRAGKGREYDALIGLSGGLDSTYAAYVARSQGLRLLGVHVDNGWNTKLADKNIRVAADRLGIDLVVEKPSFEQFRDLQLAFLRASVPNAEIPTDHVIAAVLYQVAHHKGIRYLINGGNFATEGVGLPGSFGHYNRDLRYIRSIHRHFGTLSLDTLPTIGMFKTVCYRYLRDIRVIRILNYVDYQRELAAKTLSKEIGWEAYGGKHNESVYTRFFQSYILPNKFGVDKRRMHLSALVCAGQLSREEVLKEFAKPPYDGPELLERDMEEVLEKLRITRDEFEEIMQIPVRNARDFPSNKWLFDLVRWLARRGLRLGE